MNARLVLHLMRKDARWRRADVITLWALLTIYVLIPVLQESAGLPAGYSIVFWLGESLLITVILGLMLGLQFDWLNLDHPRDSGAFLSTRPASRLDSALAKLLVWIVLALGPALLAVMARLAMQRMDLRPEDYIRVGLRDLIVLLGFYGLVSAIAFVLRWRRTVLAIGLVLALMMTGVLSLSEIQLWPNLSPEALHMVVMEHSRVLAALCVVLALGYGVTGSALLRAQPAAKGAWLVAGVLACLAVRLWFPCNLVWRSDRLHREDPERLEQLQKQTSIEVAGKLSLKMRAIFKDAVARSDPFRIHGESGMEFPELASYNATALFPNSLQLQRSMRPGHWEGRSWTSVPAPAYDSQLDLDEAYAHDGELIDPLPLMKVLGLPSSLAQKLRDNVMTTTISPLQRRAGIGFQLSENVPSGQKAKISGDMTLAWYRPVMVGSIPLKEGAAFARDGHRVYLRRVGIIDGKLIVDYTVQHAVSLIHAGRRYDSDPAFAMWIINPVRKEIAYPKPSHEASTTSRILDVETVQTDATYLRLGEGNVPRDFFPPEWLGEARLCILIKQGIGRTVQPLEGELETESTLVNSRP